jgi:hypothetical protein
MTSSDEIRVALEHAEKFVIHEQIAEGANAVAVFRAFDRLLQREVFLKVMYYSPDFAADLLHEPRVLVQATQAIPKPENLVQVFAADILTDGYKGPAFCPPFLKTSVSSMRCGLHAVFCMGFRTYTPEEFCTET